MKRLAWFGLAVAALLAAAYGASEIGSTASANRNAAVKWASAIDDAWWVVVEDATGATAEPYQPSTISADLRLDMVGYSGLVLRMKYPDDETVSTAAVVYVWGRKGSDWCGLPDVNGSLSITLDDAATDSDDGSAAKWTAVSAKIDALGCTEIVVTVATAGVASGAGALSVEATRF